MRTRTALLNICLALLIPLTAGAKKPESDECQIALAGPVSPGSAFQVIVRPGVDSGAWIAPTIAVEVSLPIESPPGLGTSPASYSQIVTQTFDDGGREIARSFFIIPEPGYLALDTMGTIEVFATVSEPVNRGKSIESFCETTASF